MPRRAWRATNPPLSPVFVRGRRFAGDILTLVGQNLRGADTRVWLDGHAVVPRVLSDTTLQIALDVGVMPWLRAGFVSLSVETTAADGTRVSSETVSFAIHPHVELEPVAGQQAIVHVTPSVGPGQTVQLQLMPLSGTTSAAVDLVQTAAPAGTLRFSLDLPLQPGRYIACVVVDGAQSRVAFSPDGQIVGPLLDVR